MNVKVNQDGKFWDRLVAAAIPMALGLGIAGIVWWRDASNSDSRASEAITRMESRMDKIEADAREARRSAAEDRQKTAEMAADLRNVTRGVARIETLLDRWAPSTPPIPSRP